MRRVLITGAGGFIGRHLAERLAGKEREVQRLERDSYALASSPATLSAALRDVEAIVHLAGIAHRKASAQALETINADLPVRLYQAAATAGVGRFIQLSSIKVLGDVSAAPLTPQLPYRPGDAYARSKVAAEQALLAASAGAATRLTIIRPPLVYGPGVKANFRLLLKLAALGRRGIPLPLGGADAPRSLVSVHNLCDLIAATLAGPPGTYHVADGRDWTVAGLLRHWGVPANRLLRVSANTAARMLRPVGLGSVHQRLFLPLQVDLTDTTRQLGWQPDADPERFLDETLTWYLQQR